MLLLRLPLKQVEYHGPEGRARRRAVLGRPGRPLPGVAELLRRRRRPGNKKGNAAQGPDSVDTFD